MVRNPLSLAGSAELSPTIGTFIRMTFDAIDHLIQTIEMVDVPTCIRHHRCAEIIPRIIILTHTASLLRRRSDVLCSEFKLSIDRPAGSKVISP
jgi:hypothetical protein